MVDQASNNTDTPENPVAAPEEAVLKRIQPLREKLDKLRAELKTLETRVTQSSQEKVKAIHQENEKIYLSIGEIQQLLKTAIQIRSSQSAPETLSLKTSTLKAEAIQLFTQLKVNPELWKNLVS